VWQSIEEEKRKQTAEGILGETFKLDFFKIGDLFCVQSEFPFLTSIY